MNAKQMAALCSCLGLTLTGALSADSGMNDRMNSNKPMPFFEQGTPLKQSDMQMREQQDPNKMGQFPAAYPQAASVRLDNSCDFWITGSFIYWMASSDGFNVAQFPIANAITGTATGTSNGTNTYGTINAAYPTGVGFSNFIKPKYKPGFKVAIGWDTGFDDWEFMAEYTWYRANEKNSITASTGSEFFYDDLPANTPTVASMKWRDKMQLLDVGLGRCFYVGKRVTMGFSMGIRADWFTDKLTMNGTNAAGTQYFTSTTRTKSWGLGPRIGLDSMWIIGGGFRVDGRAAGSLLFTRYTKLNYDSTTTVTSTGGSGAGAAVPVAFQTVDLDLGNSGCCGSNGKYDVMRPNAELGLGFGWGTYCCDNEFHFDIAARYDMQVFWDQNMTRTVVENVNNATGWNPRDQFYHGPTVTLRLDF